MCEIEKLLLREIYVQQKPYSVELKKKLRSLAVPGKYNFFLFMHLGDDFIRLNIKPLFERQFGKMHFIIQPNEVFLMDLFGISKNDYTIFDYKTFLSQFLPKESEDVVIREYTYMNIVENTVLSVPNTYEPFICWGNNLCSCKEYEENYGKFRDIFSFIKATLGIINNKKIDFSAVTYPLLTAALSEKLSTNGVIDLDRTILFLPEARSDEMLDKRFWEYLAENLIEKGFTVIENVMRPENHINGCINLALSLNELIALGISCYAIFSLRSGLCDIFELRGKKLYVFWTKDRLKGCGDFFNFLELYDSKEIPLPVEIILDRKEKCSIVFDETDIAKGLPKEYLPKSTSKVKKWIQIFKDLSKEKSFGYAVKIVRRKLNEIILIRLKNIFNHFCSR